jgi:micrococcal nuclease
MDSKLYFYEARLTDTKKIYDGDTLRLDIGLGFNQWLLNKSCRLYGINTKEVRGESKEEGLVARDYLRALLEDSVESKEVDLVIKSHKDSTDKYGRLLITLYTKQGSTGWLDVNALLLDEGLAEVYKNG